MEKQKCNHEFVDHWDSKVPEWICIYCKETKAKKLNNLIKD